MCAAIAYIARCVQIAHPRVQLPSVAMVLTASAKVGGGLAVAMAGWLRGCKDQVTGFWMRPLSFLASRADLNEPHTISARRVSRPRSMFVAACQRRAVRQGKYALARSASDPLPSRLISSKLDGRTLVREDLSTLGLGGSNTMKNLALAIAFAAAAFAVPATADAAPCKDAKGKFIKCPPAPAAAQATAASRPAATHAARPAAARPATPATTHRCRDAKGRFARCGTPGARPS